LTLILSNYTTKSSKWVNVAGVDKGGEWVNDHMNDTSTLSRVYVISQSQYIVIAML